MKAKRIKLDLFFKLSYLSSNLAPTLHYLNPASNNLAQKSKKFLSEGGFNLRKWISNSPKLLELICEDQVGTVGTCAVVVDTESAKTTVNHLEKLDMKHEQKVLRLNWNCVTDEFIFKSEALLRLSEDLELTRRNLLKLTSSFFDPLGVSTQSNTGGNEDLVSVSLPGQV